MLTDVSGEFVRIVYPEDMFLTLDRGDRPAARFNRRGDDPRSWQAADEIRQAGHIGLIDPSRQSPVLWHITLFKWNEQGAPTVCAIGVPEPLKIHPR